MPGLSAYLENALLNTLRNVAFTVPGGLYLSAHTGPTGGTGANEVVGSAPLATPVISSETTATTGGTLAPATYGYRISATNAYGETLASTEVTQVVPGGTSTNTVTINWGAVSGATGYRVYGRTPSGELLIFAGNVVTYTDTGAITPSGALPASNTTASYARVPIAFGAPSSGAMANTGVVTLNIPASTTVTFFGLSDAASGGNHLGGAALSSAQVFGAAGTLTFAAGQLTFALTA